MSRINDNILSILGECHVEGNTLFLPDRTLERSVYHAVNKVLVNIGGKWNRKAKGHVFDDGDPEELLNNILMTGETMDLKNSTPKQYQFFPTPRPIAQQMCRMAELDDSCTVLEPSCGNGDLADVIYENGIKKLHGVELNTDMSRFLVDKPYTTEVGVDFLEFAKDTSNKHKWNRIIMNPPFTKQQDVDHILAAYDILAPGGVLVSVVSESPFFRANSKSNAFRDFLDEHNAETFCMDEGAFRESGTMVRTRIIKVKKENAQ